MKKPTFCFCFVWIVFIKLNFTFAFLLIWKTWNDQFFDKVADGGFKKWGNASNGRMILKWGGDTPLRTMIYNFFKKF